MKKYYIYKCPSVFGMGSDTDDYLISEENLHKIMTPQEIEEAKAEEVPYERSPALVLLPLDVPVEEQSLHFSDTIFRIYPIWDYETDYIIGEAHFTRYTIDLSKTDIYFGRSFKEKTKYEFMDFDIKNVVANIYSGYYTADKLLKQLYEKQEEKDRLPREMLERERKYIQKFEHLPNLKDEYYDHFYYQKYPKYIDDYNEIARKDIAEDTVDHTKCAYELPTIDWSPRTEKFCEIDKKGGDLDECLSYEELFHTGYDIKHLAAILTGSLGDGDDLLHPQIDRALRIVLGNE